MELAGRRLRLCFSRCGEFPDLSVFRRRERVPLPERGQETTRGHAASLCPPGALRVLPPFRPRRLSPPLPRQSTGSGIRRLPAPACPPPPLWIYEPYHDKSLSSLS